MSDQEAFYLPLGENEFESTAATASPWDLALQHGGPPSALLARAVERCEASGSMPIAQMTVDFLGGIPQGRIRTSARVVKPGKRVELVEATMWANDKLAVRANAWRIRQEDDATRDVATAALVVPPIPEATPLRFFDGLSEDWGYGNAIDWRFVKGDFNEPGPASVWTRVKLPLVADEETSPVQRLLIVADSTNGLSSEMSLAEWLFIPPALSVTVQRAPQSEWLLLDAVSTIGPHGTGIAQGTVSDEHGLVSRITQPLLVAARS